MNRTRIAIPLHRSLPWVDNVAGNIRRLAGSAAITVSDATGDDDALEILREELGAIDGIDWIGPREIAPGWVSHCNDLLERSREHYFAWLPHDDEIGADWVTDAEEVLDAVPDAVLAFGPIVPLYESGVTNGGHRIDPFEPFSNPDSKARIHKAAEISVFGDPSLLGASFRGVMRTDRAVPLPTDHDRDEWADVLWAVRMLVRGSFAPIPAVYGKRWHPGNTHSTWGDARLLGEFRSRLLPRALVDLDDAERESVLTATWSAEAAAHSADILALRAEVAAAHARGVQEARDAFESSRSWRITRPLRRLTTALDKLGHHDGRRGREDRS